MDVTDVTTQQKQHTAISAIDDLVGYLNLARGAIERGDGEHALVTNLGPLVTNAIAAVGIAEQALWRETNDRLTAP